MEDINRIVESRAGNTHQRNKNDEKEFAMPLWTQIMATTRRAFIAYWRTPEYALFMLHIFTGLFNTFTFWHLGNSYIDMQSRLFSVFMTLTISSPLIQQLQPRYLHFRGLYESRESSSKLLLDRIRGQHHPSRNTLFHRRRIHLLQLLVLGHLVPPHLLPHRFHLAPPNALRAFLHRLRAIHRRSVPERPLRLPPRPRLLHLRRGLLRRRRALPRAAAFLAVLDVLAYAVSLSARGVFGGCCA